MTTQELYKLGANIGKNVSFIGPIHPNIFSSEPYLITIGDNTTISFDVVFCTHDGATRVLRNLAINEKEKQTVIYNKIKVGNNCFIGCRSIIMPGVTIGDNCIIGAGSIVTKDIPSNSVCAGQPCKIICSIDEYKEKHNKDFLYCVNMKYDDKKKYLLSILP